MIKSDFMALPDNAAKRAAWDLMTAAERKVCASDAGLTPQLLGVEGYRVEVVDPDSQKGRRRFIVGRSAGWVPCHLEILKANSSGGIPARMTYTGLEILERVR